MTVQRICDEEQGRLSIAKVQSKTLNPGIIERHRHRSGTLYRHEIMIRVCVCISLSVGLPVWPRLKHAPGPRGLGGRRAHSPYGELPDLDERKSVCSPLCAESRTDAQTAIVTETVRDTD